jgi:hypothetical protein
MITFGEVQWGDDVFGGQDKKMTNNKDLFLRLDVGSNELRLITQPYQYLVHKYKKDESDKFGQKVSCSAIHGSCPLCLAGDKAKPRWLLGVISRKTQSYKVIDISFAVFSQIRKLANNTARWGDPTKYDIDIIVDKTAPPMSYYSVQPVSKEPLSAADQVIRDKDMDLEDLKRRVTPPTADGVQNRINKINGVESAPATKNTASKTAPAPAAVAPVSMSDEETMDEEFPAHS